MSTADARSQPLQEVLVEEDGGNCEQKQDSLRTLQPEGFGSRIFWHSSESFRPSLEIKDRIKSTIRVSSVRSGAGSKNCERNLAASEKDLPDGSEIHRALSIGMQMHMPYDADPRNKPRKSVNIFPLQEEGHEERKLQQNEKKSSAKESLQFLKRFLHVGTFTCIFIIFFVFLFR